MEIASAQQTMTQTGALDPLATVPLAISASVMTPIVFCASLVPCASETTQAEPTCPIRKPCLRAPSVSDLVIRYSSQVPQAATQAAMIGERMAGRPPWETSPCQSTALPPAAAMVEPITPPISACEELDGIPSSQVSRFQMMPPASPAATTVRVTLLVETRPLAMVAATARERNAPTKLSTPDMATAVRGPSAPVAIDVAMALPVSWKPLVKSKAKATMTTNTRTVSLLTTATVNLS